MEEEVVERIQSFLATLNNDSDEDFNYLNWVRVAKFCPEVLFNVVTDADRLCNSRNISHAVEALGRVPVSHQSKAVPVLLSLAYNKEPLIQVGAIFGLYWIERKFTESWIDRFIYSFIESGQPDIVKIAYVIIESLLTEEKVYR